MSEELRNKIKEDEKYKKFKNAFLKEYKKIDLEVDKDQLINLQSTRLSRTLYGKKEMYSANSLMEASLQDLAARSRMVEIRVQLSRRLALLEALISSISKHIYSNYLVIEPSLKTEAQKNNFITDFLAVYKEYVKKGTPIVEMADAFIKDIDQAGFSLRNMMDCLKLLSETKGKII